MTDTETLAAHYLHAVNTGQDTTRLEAALDAETTQHADRLRATGSLLAAALWYAEQGLHVFPLTPLGKIPLPGTKGFKDATADTDRIRAWWKVNPDFNIGLATGHRFDVIDFDGPEAIAYGYTHDVWPPVVGKVSTPRPGGNHWYVNATGAGNRAGMAPHVDYRGIGGYVVAPPSRTDQGEYEWLQPLVTA